MKRFLPILAALMIGCAGAPAKGISVPSTTTEQTAEPKAKPEAKSEPTHISRGDWSIELPSKWTFNEVPKDHGSITQVLEALSTYDVGRGPVRFSLGTMPWDSDPIVFAKVVSMQVERVLTGAKVVRRSLVKIDGRTASLTVLLTENKIETGIVALAVGETGYVLTCTGDAAKPSVEKEQVKTCVSILTSFKVKGPRLEEVEEE